MKSTGNQANSLDRGSVQEMKTLEKTSSKAVRLLVKTL